MNKEMNDAMLNLRKSGFELIEYMQHVAKWEFAKYEALVNEGFTKEQALEIIKARPVIELPKNN